jgi:serine/threonine protein kinase
MMPKKLAHYEIIEKIGAGGMGEVYRARDTKLARDVALKILPEDFASDSERLARFDREAKLLASLNHSHIGAIYGLEQDNAQRFLVLEMIEGEDLAQRISRGAIPVDETLLLCRQIAEALEVAHEQGVVHRDLKPANVKVSPDGEVKVLDFGLAKALDTEPGATDISKSPTLMTGATMQGVILGTAGYMSPEQARGRSADKRSDIWAFGCVLFEMLTGKQAFAGETVSDTLASVLAREADWKALPDKTPPAIERLLRRCLEKQAKQRLRDIGEARITIDAVLGGEADAVEPVAASPTVAKEPAKRSLTPVLLAGTMAIIAAVGWVSFFRANSRESRVIRASVAPPADSNFELASGHPGPVRISPDGTQLVFAARQGGRLQLWIRPLDEVEARPLSGTEGAGYPFWSPDSRSIGFFSNGKLKRVDASGGPPLTICDASNGKGGTWNEDNVIVFAPAHNTPIHRVKATGGESTPMTKIDVAAGQNSHRHPRFLPDGDHFLYYARSSGSSGSNPSGVWVRSLDGGDEKLLFHSDTWAAYAANHLFYLRESALMVQKFDVGALEMVGDARPIVENIYFITGAAAAVFDVSDDGVMVYHVGGESQDEIVWVDRSGETLGAVGQTDSYGDFSLSPDDRTVAIEVYDAGNNSDDLWLIDTQTGIRTRFTYDPANDWDSRWSRDSRKIMFDSGARGHHDIYEKAVTGSDTEKLLLESGSDKYVQDWSLDGRYAAYTENDSTGQADIWILPLLEDGQPFKYNATPAEEAAPKFSPDGQWMAYRSDESGAFHIYVSPFPGPGRKWQISRDSGYFVRWRRDGKELFYVSETSLKVVKVSQQDGTFIIGAEETLFDANFGNQFQVAADGQRFVVVRNVDDQTANALTLVVNWVDALKGER